MSTEYNELDYEYSNENLDFDFDHRHFFHIDESNLTLVHEIANKSHLTLVNEIANKSNLNFISEIANKSNLTLVNEIANKSNLTYVNVLDSTNYYPDYIRTALTACNIIGGLTDVLLVVLLITTKKCRTRTLLLNMFINDALLLLRTKIFLEYILKPFHSVRCLLEHLDGILLMGYLLFIAAIQLNTIVHTKKLSTKWIISIIYTLVCIIALLRITVCMTTENFNYIGHIIRAVLLCISIITVIKDIIICYKRNWASLEPEEIIRINVARIVAYTIIITGVIMVVAHFIFQKEHARLVLKILHMPIGLRPVFVLVYLLVAQKELNMYVANLFRRRENQYDWQASIKLPDSKNDDPTVTLIIDDCENDPDEKNGTIEDALPN